MIAATQLRLGGVDLQFQCIPQKADRLGYEEHISAMLPGTAPATGRVYTALCMARLAGARTWPDAGSALDLPLTRTLRVSDVVGRRVTDLEAFWAAVHKLAQEAATAAVDYARRRRVLGAVQPSDLEEWRRCFAVREETVRTARLWLWSEVAQGELRRAPLLAAEQVSWATCREGHRKFLRDRPAATLQALAAVGSQLTGEGTTT